MIADFRRSCLIFGLLLCASIPHGKCKTNLHDTKSTKPIGAASVTAPLADVDAENARSITNLSSKTVYGTIPNDTSIPIDGLVFLSGNAAEKVGTNLRSEPHDEELRPTTPRTIYLSSMKPARLLFSTSKVVDATENPASAPETEKSKATKTKLKDKKSNVEGAERLDDNHAFRNNEPSSGNTGQDLTRKINANENRVPETKSDRISLSRGKLRFQSTDVIFGSAKAAEPDEGGRNFSKPSSLSTTKPSMAHMESTSTLTSTTKRKENSTRSPKSSSFQYRGDDGYKFETQFDFDKDDEFSPKFEDKAFRYAEDEPENNIDRIRNFNVNGGNAKIRNIVKKPQGFILTTPFPYETDNIRKTVTRLGANSDSNNGLFSNKKILPKNPDIVAPKVNISPSEIGQPSSVSKNEITNKKQSAKTTLPFNSRPRNVSSENSLPTTSTAWALASLKTPTKIQKPLSSEISKRNNVKSVVSSDKTSLDSSIKPFVSWHGRLTKTTTEDSKDWSTTLKNLIEIDVETMSPIAYTAESKVSKSNTTSKSTQSTSFAETTTVSPTNESTHFIKNKDIESVVDLTSVKHLSDVKHYIVKNDNRVDLVVYDNVTVANDSSWNPKNIISTSERALNLSRDQDSTKPNRNISSTDHILANETTNSPTVTVTTASTPSVVILEMSKPTANNDKSNVLVAAVDVSPTSENLEVAKSSLTYGNKINYSSSIELESPNFFGLASATTVANSSATTNSLIQDTNQFNEIKYSGPESVASLTGNDISDSKSVSSTQAKSKESPDAAENAVANSSEVTSNFIHVTNETTVNMANSSSENTNRISPALNITTTTTIPSNFLGHELNSSSWDTDEELDAITESIFTNFSSSTSSEPSSSTSSKPNRNISIINVTSQTKVHDDHESAEANSSENTKSESTSSTSSLSITSPKSVANVQTAVTVSSAPAFTTLTTSTKVWPPSDTGPPQETLPPESVTTVVSIFQKSENPVTTGQRNHTELFSSADNEMTTVMTYEKLPSNNETVTITMPTSSSSTKPSPSTVSTTTENEKKILNVKTTTEQMSTSTVKPKLSPDTIPGYLMLFFRSSLADVCQTSSALKENLIQFMMQRSLKIQSKDQVLVMIDPEQCKEPDHSVRLIPVALYIVDDYGGYNKDLINEMKRLLEDENLNSSLPIHEIVYHENIIPDNSKIIAAMVITSIAAVCFVLLLFLMCTIRNRQKMSHGQPCTPVTFDDYNLDNISEYNSIRRKGLARASKRSYGNPTFDDPNAPSKSLAYNGLLKACENRACLDEEFLRIPVIAVRPEELPLGAEVKNRYANVIPLPETIVSLSSNNKCNDSVIDYINANYVKGSKGTEKFYIACQAPLQNTIEDFWRMVWKEQTKVIIMLTGLTENGVEKCADYLPPSEVLDCHRLFGDFQITLKKREVKEKYVISCLQLKNMDNNLWREVTHLWYTSWPAQGVPNEQSSIIALLIEARAYMRNSKGPHVVHCSPGTGRTGTVIAIDICIRDYESTRSVNIPLTVSMLRRYRAGAVQTKEQYAFIYKVLALYAKKLNGGAALDSM